MDEKLLLELLAEAKKHGGGLVLNVGEQPHAVVLSVDAYSELLAGRGTSVLPGGEDASGAVPAAKQTLLVTGGAGYIGGHVVREALAAGFAVVIVDNLSTGRREHVPDEAVFIEGDIRDVSLLRDIFAQYHIFAVVHLAALLEVQESVEKPLEYMEVNALATLQLLGVMQDAGVKRIVFSSTAAVYGPQDVVPIPETAACAPTNPYGASKLLAEQAIHYFTKWCGMTATIFRYFNVAGTKAEWGVGDTHHRAHLVPIVLDVARNGEQSLVVNGQDWPTPDGTCVRDYVHVYDIARAHVLALLKGQSDSVATYNIGTGKGASVRDVVQAAAEVTGRMIPMEVGPRRPGDDAQLVADVSAIATALDFRAAHSSLEEIIGSAWGVK